MSELQQHYGRTEEDGVCFRTGTRQHATGRIFPIFIPFLGCPGQCVYCAQDKQTGHSASSDMHAVLKEARTRLESLSPCPAEQTRELAFYGGTFTALPYKDRRACLDLLLELREKGLISRARCSTRPDALDDSVLEEISRCGIGLVELGIQSFDDRALALSRRGYTGHEAEKGCRAVQSAGLALGIQLLPGMPGSTPEVFLDDVRRSLAARPSCLRFYPCLVPEGTVLARWYREGSFAPWSVEETVRTLGKALFLAWQAEVPVIRLSVAPEPSFDAVLLAGPRHPALGALIQAEALITAVENAEIRLGRSPKRLVLPRFCQGFIYGDHGALKPRWLALGLSPDRIVFDAGAASAHLY